MGDAGTQTFSAQLRSGEVLTFSSPDEVTKWLDAERRAFQWFTQNGSRAGGAVQELAGIYVNSFNNMRQACSNWISNPTDQNLKQNLLNAIQGFYSRNTAVRSDHEFVRVANEIEASDGPIAASAAFGYLLKQECHVSFATLKGIISAKLKVDGIDPKSPALVANTISDLNARAEVDRKKSRDEWASLTEAGHNLLASTSDDFQLQVTDFQSETAEAIRTLTDSANESISSIQQTEASYREQMKLQAPVDYWQTKATVHATALASSRRNIIIFASLGSIVLLVLLVGLAAIAVKLAGNSAAETAIFLKFAAIGAIITTVAFWVGRVLLRIYLSDRHLLTDAEERVALIKTYLALSSEGKVEASDRALILAPLFRAASDGIVKEEGPDASVAGIVAKMLDLKAGK